MSKHRPIARVTREKLEKNMSEGPCRTAIIHALNLDVFDAIEGIVVVGTYEEDAPFIIFDYLGTEHTLERDCIELISRYTLD